MSELDLAERVREELTRFQLPGRALCLEVTEEAVLRDPERARAALGDVRRLGVAIALDSFGGRDSSITLPRNLPLDMLKLDRGLIQSFERDRETRAMVAAMIALAHKAGLTAVAVGIETNRQLALARELDCTVGQGFLLHRPDSPERLRLTGDAGAVTSAPWRPRVRLGESSRRTLSDAGRGRAAQARGGLARRPSWFRTACAWASARARRWPTCCRRSASAPRRSQACAAWPPRRRPASMARALGLEVEELDELGELDLAIDGADQVDPAGWLVKGGGAAHTREKIVAAAAKHFVVIVSAEKVVERLAAPIPLELVPWAAQTTLRALGDAQLRDVPRSPDGGLIADYLGAVGDPRALAEALSAQPGVVEHGLFVPEMVSSVLIAGDAGVERRAGAKRED